MSTSQFTLYSSSDASGPGLLTGQAGALLALLDACLVNGYSGKAAAGWTKPFANSGNIGCYKQGAGSFLSVLINDNSPNGTSISREAWLTGWESIASIGAPVGTGSGQFPTPAQSLTTGHVVCRKSVSADGVGRSWQLFADASTYYLFISTGDTVGVYYPSLFGDIFSLKGASDAYRCMIIGRCAENSSAGANISYDSTDCINASLAAAYVAPISNTGAAGHFMARTYGGGGTSIVISKLCDLSKMSINGAAVTNIHGLMQMPNGPDNSVFLSPIVVAEPTTASVRGRIRGLYQICHPAASFSDGQTFAGGGDYSGKSFMVIKACVGGGYFAIETSATIETN